MKREYPQPAYLKPDKTTARRQRLRSLLAAAGVEGCLLDNATERGLAVSLAMHRIAPKVAAALGLFLMARLSSQSMTLQIVASKLDVTLKKLRRSLSILRKVTQKAEPALVVPSVTCNDTFSVLEALVQSHYFSRRAEVMPIAREVARTHSGSGNLPSTVAAGALAIALQSLGLTVDLGVLSAQAGIARQTLQTFLKTVSSLAPQQSTLLSAKRSTSNSDPAQALVLAVIEGAPCRGLPPVGQLDAMKEALSVALEGMRTVHIDSLAL